MVYYLLVRNKYQKKYRCVEKLHAQDCKLYDSMQQPWMWDICTFTGEKQQ